MHCRVIVCLVISIVCSAALEQGRSSWTGKLLVVPMDGSHWTGMKAVAEEMGRRGHTVIVVIPEISMCLGPGKHYITKTFPGTHGQDLINQMIVEHIHESGQSLLKSVTSVVAHLIKIINCVTSTTESLFNNQELIDFLREQNFDAVLTDPALPVGAILAYNLSIPAVYMLRAMPCGLDAAATACPDPPSYVPRFNTRNSDRMSFDERVVNIFVSMLEPLICKVTFWPFKEITFNFLQRDVSLIEILSTAAVWLMRYDFSLEFPKPLMPNMQLIGGINCEIRNPLKKILEIFQYSISSSSVSGAGALPSCCRQDILNGKTLKWYPPKSFHQVPVYLDSEEQQDNLFAFLKSVLHKTPMQLSFMDEVRLICGVLFPEAIIYGLAGLQNLSLQDAEQDFLSGPDYHHSEVEEFNRVIEKQLTKERASRWSQ